MQFKTPAQLTAFTSVGEIDDANDKLVLWDQSQGVLKSVTFRVLDEDSLELNVNDERYGLTASARLKAILAVGSNITVYFPPGSYALTADTFQLTGSNVNIIAHGATIDFGGGQGIVLVGGNGQSNIHLDGGTWTNWIGAAFGIPADGSQDDTTKIGIKVTNSIFRDASSSGTSGNSLNVEAIKLSCRTRRCKIIGNHVENLSHTDTGATDSTVYGIILGRKGDEMGGSRTGESQSYGEDGTTAGNAEGFDVISGNSIRRLSNYSSTSTIRVTGILADGWKQQIVNNNIESIQYLGSGVTGNAGIGIYVRGYDTLVSGNNISDCTSGCVWVKDGSSSSTYGPLGGYVISGNTFRSVTIGHTRGAAQKIIGIYNGRVKVTDNYFDKCVTRSNGSGLSGVLIEPSTFYDDIEITNNTFYKCTSELVSVILGARWKFSNNQIINPVGPYGGTGSWFMLNSYAGSAVSDWQVHNNTVVIDESTFSASGTCYGLNLTADAAINGLSFSGNRFLGWSAANPAETWRLTNINNTVSGHKHWSFLGNSTDAVEYNGSLPSTIEAYHGLTVSGGGAMPRYIVKRWDFGAPVAIPTTSGLGDHASGMEVTNAGASGTVTYSLPAAVTGLIFTFFRIASQAVRIDPNGAQTIGSGGAGKYLSLDSDGASVVLRCLVAGSWVISSSIGTTSFEP